MNRTEQNRTGQIQLTQGWAFLRPSNYQGLFLYFSFFFIWAKLVARNAVGGEGRTIIQKSAKFRTFEMFFGVSGSNFGADVATEAEADVEPWTSAASLVTRAARTFCTLIIRLLAKWAYALAWRSELQIRLRWFKAQAQDQSRPENLERFG